MKLVKGKSIHTCMARVIVLSVCVCVCVCACVPGTPDPSGLSMVLEKTEFDRIRVSIISTNTLRNYA